MMYTTECKYPCGRQVGPDGAAPFDRQAQFALHVRADRGSGAVGDLGDGAGWLLAETVEADHVGIFLVSLIHFVGRTWVAGGR